MTTPHTHSGSAAKHPNAKDTFFSVFYLDGFPPQPWIVHLFSFHLVSLFLGIRAWDRNYERDFNKLDRLLSLLDTGQRVDEISLTTTIQHWNIHLVKVSSNMTTLNWRPIVRLLRTLLTKSLFSNKKNVCLCKNEANTGMSVVWATTQSPGLFQVCLHALHIHDTIAAKGQSPFLSTTAAPALKNLPSSLPRFEHGSSARCCVYQSCADLPYHDHAHHHAAGYWLVLFTFTIIATGSLLHNRTLSLSSVYVLQRSTVFFNAFTKAHPVPVLWRCNFFVLEQTDPNQTLQVGWILLPVASFLSPLSFATLFPLTSQISWKT